MMDLNTLNNKQLREKCLEYGLPNVPVTDSSRKILIKRLHNIMQGTSKTSSPANRRKTIAATITTTISSGDEEDDNVKASTKRVNNVSRRRTVAPTEINRNSTNISVAPNAYNQNISPMEFEIQNRASSTRINDHDPRRRSVSLSKTGVLTTSYSQDTVPLQTNYEQNGNEYEEMQEDQVDEVEIPHTMHGRPSYGATNYTQTNYNRSNYNAGNFTTLPMPPPAEPTIPNTLYPNLNNAGLQTDYYGLDGMLASHSSSVRQSKLGFSYNPPTSYIPSPASPTSTRQTIGVGLGGGSDYGGQFSTSPIKNATLNNQNSGTKRYTTVTKRHTARSIDDEGGASSSDEGQFEAPYLNKFSRNLENIRTDPLANRSSTSNYAASSSPMSRYSSFSPTITTRRRTYEDNGVTFAQYWTALEQKYNLKQAFIFAMCFILAVFIYVFFLQ